MSAIAMSKYMVEKLERERQSGSCSEERGRTEEAKVERNRLMCVACVVASGESVVPSD